MTEPILTPRLRLCADLCPDGERLIDVGCDHGYLAITLVRSGKVKTALACDLRRGPLKNAEENIALYGLTDKIHTHLADGLDGVEGGAGDMITICGMGGDNIAQILERAPWTKDSVIIAQPMTKQHRLRAFLAKNGYTVTAERLVYEDRRLYTAMVIERGNYEGPKNMMYSAAMESDPLFGDWLKMLYRKYRKIYLGGGRPEDGAVMAELEEKIKCL